jgi:hypothetical protein
MAVRTPARKTPVHPTRRRSLLLLLVALLALLTPAGGEVVPDPF